MTKTQLIAKVAGYGLPVEDKDTKEILMEKVANYLSENGKDDELLEFLEENGFTLDEEGNVVKRTRRRSLGENPNTKAFHTIAVLQDESLAHLSYPELKDYLKETVGIDTTSSSIAWYAAWLKTKGKPVVARNKPKKEKAPKPAVEAEPEAPEVEAEAETPEAEAEEI